MTRYVNQLILILWRKLYGLQDGQAVPLDMA